MVVTINSGIVFDFPKTWERAFDGNLCVFKTPRQEFIIISACHVSGDGPAAERTQVLDRVFANGLESAEREVSNPDLRVTKPLAEESGVCALRCATVFAETTARDAFYGEAVIQHSQGVILLTYKAPFVDGAEQSFRDLLRMIHES